jgi:hypothetical protein
LDRDGDEVALRETKAPVGEMEVEELLLGETLRDVEIVGVAELGTLLRLAEIEVLEVGVFDRLVVELTLGVIEDEGDEVKEAAPTNNLEEEGVVDKVILEVGVPVGVIEVLEETLGGCVTLLDTVTDAVNPVEMEGVRVTETVRLEDTE